MGPDPFPDCVLLPCPEVEERKYLEEDCVVLLSSVYVFPVPSSGPFPAAPSSLWWDPY